MEEIKYKLESNNGVVVANAIDKLIFIIKSKYNPKDKQKFILDNVELKFLLEKCLSNNTVVSLTASQGLLALVELGVLEIAYTMSTILTMIPSAHNSSVIISTMTGLLTLDLKSRLNAGQSYKCPFSFKSPQHPFITMLEKKPEVEDEILLQMQSLCIHSDHLVSSNSLELLRPVFFWMTCNPQRLGNIRPWQLLLSLPETEALSSLIVAFISCQPICNPKFVKHAFAGYSVVTEMMLLKQKEEYITALLPMLARVSNELVKCGEDPRPCYNLMERCFNMNSTKVQDVSGLTITLLAENLTHSSPLYLEELLHLCEKIITKYRICALSLSTFVAYALQWLHLPSYLTTSALKTAANLLEKQQSLKEIETTFMANLKSNKVARIFLQTDRQIYRAFKISRAWEQKRNDPEKLKIWLDNMDSIDGFSKFNFASFLFGVIMIGRHESWYEDVVLKALDILVRLADDYKELSIQLSAVLIYKIANEKSPRIKMHCLKTLPSLAKTKESVPSIVALLNKLEAKKGVPLSFLIMLHARLTENQVRCFPYLQQLLMSSNTGRADDLKWETDIARAMAVKRICEIRGSSQGLELVGVISSVLNGSGAAEATALVVQALAALWRARAVAPPATWRAAEPKLTRDNRTCVQISTCGLLALVPSLRVTSPQYAELETNAVRRLWTFVAESHAPEVVRAACDALAHYDLHDYALKQIPQIYRKTVKLPSSYCKTPIDAARNPEDVLDYVPCEVWPEVFKYTNQAALDGVQRLATKLIEREVRAYRSGVYQRDGNVEPQDLNYLQPTSVLRGLMFFFRKQATTPTYDCPDTVLIAILQALSSEYTKPLPPCDLLFLHQPFKRGIQWVPGTLTLAARQALVSPSGRRFVETFLKDIKPGETEESIIDLLFDLLPVLCSGLPPNALRGPLDACLSVSYAAVSEIKASAIKESEVEKLQFVRHLLKIKECLECESIHEANRTLLSQIVENFYNIIDDDNVVWPACVVCCAALPVPLLERMTSPSSWWEVGRGSLRRANAVRSACARAHGDPRWLIEIIDAHTHHDIEREYSLECIASTLKSLDPDAASTRRWFVELMARTQVAFKELEEESAKLYLCDVLMQSAIVLSGEWVLAEEVAASRSARCARFPAAVAALVARAAWADCAPQLLEWLRHSRDCGAPSAAASCARALVAARHYCNYPPHNVWNNLEKYLGQSLDED